MTLNCFISKLIALSRAKYNINFLVHQCLSTEQNILIIVQVDLFTNLYSSEIQTLKFCQQDIVFPI